MKPLQEIAENDKLFDGVNLEIFPETYNVLFISKCFRLAPHIPIIYINKTLSAMRVCEICYLTKLSDHEEQRYQYRNAWHSIGQIQPFNTVCFCCIKIHANEQVLFNPILERPLCFDCYFVITDDERDNICQITDRCTPFGNLSDTNYYTCDKPVYFFRQRADNCENCRVFIDFKLSVEDPNSHIVRQSLIESDSESDSEPNEVDYGSKASTIIFERK